MMPKNINEKMYLRRRQVPENIKKNMYLRRRQGKITLP